MTFLNAQQSCANDGASLPIISSEEENQSLVALLESNSKVNNFSVDRSNKVLLFRILHGWASLMKQMRELGWIQMEDLLSGKISTTRMMSGRTLLRSRLLAGASGNIQLVAMHCPLYACEKSRQQLLLNLLLQMGIKLRHGERHKLLNINFISVKTTKTALLNVQPTARTRCP